MYRSTPSQLSVGRASSTVGSFVIGGRGAVRFIDPFKIVQLDYDFNDSIMTFYRTEFVVVPPIQSLWLYTARLWNSLTT
jgi:hypothetical protein